VEKLGLSHLDQTRIKRGSEKGEGRGE